MENLTDINSFLADMHQIFHQMGEDTMDEIALLYMEIKKLPTKYQTFACQFIVNGAFPPGHLFDVCCGKYRTVTSSNGVFEFEKFNNFLPESVGEMSKVFAWCAHNGMKGLVKGDAI